jgi:hypothetical protein
MTRLAAPSLHLAASNRNPQEDDLPSDRLLNRLGIQNQPHLSSLNEQYKEDIRYERRQNYPLQSQALDPEDREGEVNNSRQT